MKSPTTTDLTTTTSTPSNRTLFDKTFRDRDAHIVIMQWPNAPLYAWIGLRIAAAIAKGSTAKALTIAAAIVLAVWALLEIFKGVNYFRRALGLLVLIGTVLSLNSM